MTNKSCQNNFPFQSGEFYYLCQGTSFLMEHFVMVGLNLLIEGNYTVGLTTKGIDTQNNFNITFVRKLDNPPSEVF